MLKNELVGREYVELYAGGASVALSLLYEDYASHIHINDLNTGLASFWQAAVETPDELCARIAETPVTVEEWHAQRALHESVGTSLIGRAFATLFLNRTSRSGIIGGGIIGGFDQTGKWKIDARFNRDDLIRRVRKIARHRNRITVSALDAAVFIESCLPEIVDGFVYLDPPYYVKGGGLYQDSYGHDDHAAIAALVGGIDHPWIVSYDAAPEIAALYDKYASRSYSLSYSAQARYQGTELIFAKPGLSFPEVEAPGQVSGKAVEESLVHRLAG